MTTAGWPSIVAVLREQLGSMRNIPRPPVAYPAGTIGNRGRPLSASLAEHGRCLRDALSWLGSRCRPLSATACAAACCWGYTVYGLWGVYEDPALQSNKQQQKMNKRKRKGESTITEDRRYASDHLSKRKALNTFMDSLFFWKKSVCSVFFARRW